LRLWGAANNAKIDKLLLLARDLRARAEEVLAQAETMKNSDARQKMRTIAASYEKLAQGSNNGRAGRPRGYGPAFRYDGPDARG
jgi:hypothetical protein